MESAIRKLKISALKGTLELCRITCASLENEFSQPDVPAQKRIELFRRWDAIMKDRNAAQIELESLEQAEQVGYGDPDVLTPWS